MTDRGDDWTDAEWLAWDGEVEAKEAVRMARLEAEDEHREECPHCGDPLVDPTPYGTTTRYYICGLCYQHAADQTYDRLRDTLSQGGPDVSPR